MMALIVIGVIVVLVLLVVMSIYNRLVALRNHYKNGFAQIEVQLKRRHDLIPNLVNTAKGYMKHERETLEGVIQARNQAVSSLGKAAQDPTSGEAMQGLMGAEGALTGAIGKLFALAESYPDLKANENMLALQEELTTTENKVSFSRQAYNDMVMTYNTYRQSVPAILFASLLGHPTDATHLEFDSAAIAKAPEVSF